MKKSSRVIIAIIAVLIVVLLWYKLSARNPLPDSDQIIEQLDSAVDSANNRSTDGVMDIISGDYQDSNGENPEQLHLLLRRGIANAQNLKVDMTGVYVSVNGQTAQSTCHLTVQADGTAVFDQPVTLTWKKETTHRYLIIPSQVWRVDHAAFAGTLPDANYL